MNGEDVLSYVVSGWALLMAVSPALQIRKMLRTGTSEDVSVGYFAVLVVGFVLWVAYGLVQADWVLYVPNTVATLFGAATIGIALRLRRGSGVTESGA